MRIGSFNEAMAYELLSHRNPYEHGLISRLQYSRWNMFLAFSAGLIIGTVGGMLSWLAAAAYLETQRSRHREVNARPDAAKFAADRDFAVCVDQGGDWTPRMRGQRRPDRSVSRTKAPVVAARPS